MSRPSSHWYGFALTLASMAHAPAQHPREVPAPELPPSHPLSFERTPVHVAIAKVLAGTELEVVVHSRVHGEVTTTVDAADPEQALRDLASAIGCGVATDQFGVACVGGSLAAAHPEKAWKPADGHAVAGMEAGAAILRLGEIVGASIVVGPGVEGRVERPIEAVDWRDALRQLAPAGTVVCDHQGVAFVVRRPPRTADPPRFVFDDVDADTVLQNIAMHGDVKLAVDGDVQGRVTLRTARVPWRHALQLAAEAVGASVLCRADGSYRVTKRSPLEASELARRVAIDVTPQPPNASVPGAAAKLPLLPLESSYYVLSTAVEGLPLRDLAELFEVITEGAARFGETLAEGRERFRTTQLRVNKSQLFPLFRFCFAAELVATDDGKLELVPYADN
jgi:hypothetical protein